MYNGADKSSLKSGIVSLAELRKKRQAVKSIIDTVLQGAQLLSNTRGFKLFNKPGGYQQGTRDFLSFGIKDAQHFKNTVWGKRGDHTILFYSRHGAGVLDIRTLRQLPDGTQRMEIDKIRYID